MILSLACTFLSKAKLPLEYWNYTVKHVVDCKNTILHGTKNQVPYEILYGKKSSHLSHLKPFGSRMHFHPNVKNLKTFEEKIIEGLNLRHEGGGMYQKLTKEVALRNKHTMPRNSSSLDLRYLTERKV